MRLIWVICLFAIGVAVSESKVERVSIEDFEYEMPSVTIEGVRITYYEPVEGQCDDTPLVTANGSVIDTIKLKKQEIRWCAVSRDIEELFPMGSEIEIFISDNHRWNGVWRIMDRTSSRLTKTIDILSNTDNGGCYRGTIKEI